MDGVDALDAVDNIRHSLMSGFDRKVGGRRKLNDAQWNPPLFCKVAVANGSMVGSASLKPPCGLSASAYQYSSTPYVSEG